MKKRLLFAFMAMCAAVSGYALEQGEFVYTPQGRFQITGANQNANNAFQDFTGWTVVSASAEKELKDIFNMNANGYADGINSMQSLDATEGEGMSYKFEPSDASASYVVSYKLKGATAVSVRVKTVAVSTNLIKINSIVDGFDGEGNPTTEETVANTAEELSENWQTFNYAIVGDGTPRTWYISLTGIATNIEIADLQIAPAVQVADLRQRDAMLEKINVYKNCYNWSDAVLEDMGMNEAVELLNAIGDGSPQVNLNEAVTTSQEILDEFLKANMDDYLAGSNRDNYFDTWRTKWQKVSTIGDWTCLPAGRGFWENAAQGCVDLGHFQNGATWNNGAPTTPMGVYMQKTLDPGSYVFSIESKAAVREPKKGDWNNDDGMKPAYGIAYIVKVVDGADPDTIVSVVKGLEPVNMTTFLVPATIAEAGIYEIGFKSYCKETHQSLAQGSVTYVYNASLWGKNENIYNQKQLNYEADVREQISTGRTQLTTAFENLANADYLWGKAELTACVDTVETRIIAYEDLTQDEIIATYQEDYVKSTSEETGYMVYEVYQKAVKDIIAANRRFTALNDTLASIQTAIDYAEATYALRIYDVATGKADLQAAINTAKDVQAQMKASQYSEENAATIVAAIETLNEAVEAFKASVPASAIATIVDIDFENDAVLNEESQLYSIAGAAGAMEFSHFSTTAPEGEDSPFQQGHWDNGEQKWKGYLRVGNGTGTVNFDPVGTTEGMGTDILKISCDMYIQGLSKRFVGFTLKNEVDSTLAGLYRNYYDGADEVNTLNADMTKVWAKSGGTYNDASPADAEEPTANPLEKTSFEVIMDYGTMTAYANISSPAGSTTSTPVAFTEVPVKFVLQCNYDNKFATRRCWFDNLKIQRIGAGAVDGIQEVRNAAAKVVAPSKMIKNGRIIINGKYTVSGTLVK